MRRISGLGVGVGELVINIVNSARGFVEPQPDIQARDGSNNQLIYFVHLHTLVWNFQ